MADGLVLDANVIVKLVVEEPRSTLAQAIFDDERFDFWIPSHALAEVMEVLCRKLRRGEIGEAQLREAGNWLPGTFLTVPLDNLLDAALDIALRNCVSIYDLVYLALACARDLRLVTDDRRFVERLSGVEERQRTVLLEHAASHLFAPAPKNPS